MRIYTIEEVKPPKNVGKSWETTLRIRMHESSIPNYGQVDSWTRRNIEGTYILMAFMSQHIAGGAFGIGHNANITHCPDRNITIDYYELRFTKKQAASFLKTWRIPKAEYERNMAYANELENRKQGWTKVDGKTVPTSQIVALARQSRKFKRMCINSSWP